MLPPKFRRKTINHQLPSTSRLGVDEARTSQMCFDSGIWISSASDRRNPETCMYSHRIPNIAMDNGPGLKMYCLLKMGIYSIAMLVYQRVISYHIFLSFSNFAYNLVTYIITWNRCNGNRITVEAIEILFERHSGRLSSKMLVPVKRNGRRQSSVLCQRMCAELSPPRLLLPATNSWPLLTLEDIQTLARKRLEKLICN